MRAISAVRIDDDFTSRKPAVAVRSADNEPARGVDENLCIVVDKVFGDCGFYDLFDNIFSYLFLRYVGVVLCGNDNRIDAFHNAVVIFDGNL